MNEYWGRYHYNENGDVNDEQHSLEMLRNSFEKLSIETTGAVILDVGCGNGRLSSLCKYASQYVGIDNNDRNIIDDRYVKNNIFIKTNIFSFYSAPIFDIVFFIGSFYIHFDLGYQATLEKAVALLADDGLIVMHEHNDNIAADNISFSRFNLKELCEYLKLEIIYILPVGKDYSIITIRKRV
jgi:SAM-dependent methyltransferase